MCQHNNNMFMFKAPSLKNSKINFTNQSIQVNLFKYHHHLKTPE